MRGRKKKKRKKSILPSRSQTSAEETGIKSVPQLSPSHPSHRKYSAKRPVGHQPFRQPCLSEIFDSYFCCLLISTPPPSLPPILLLLSGSWHLSQRRHFTAHPLFPPQQRKGRGGRSARTKLPVHPLPAQTSPPYFLFSHGPITRGLEGYHTPYFTWRRYLQPLKIYFYERERQRKREACSLSSTVHWDSGEENHQQKPSSSEHTNLQSPNHCSGKGIHFLNRGKRE